MLSLDDEITTFLGCEEVGGGKRMDRLIKKKWKERQMQGGIKNRPSMHVAHDNQRQDKIKSDKKRRKRQTSPTPVTPEDLSIARHHHELAP